MQRRVFSRLLFGAPVSPFAGRGLVDEALSSEVSTRYPATHRELEVGVTPADSRFPPPHPERYGAIGDGLVNDQVALDACLLVNKRLALSPGKKYLVRGILVTESHVSIVGSEGAGLVIDDSPGSSGLRFVSPSGSGKHFQTGFVGRDFSVTSKSSRHRITGIFVDNAEITLLENVNIDLSRNVYAGREVGDGSIAFRGYFQQDGMFVKCSFTGGSGDFGDGVYLDGCQKANETPNNNYFHACRAQSCGGTGVRVRIGDGNVWRGGKIQANRGGGWIEGDDGLGSGPSNTIVADMGFEANLVWDINLCVSSGTRVLDCTFQSTQVANHILESRYGANGFFARNSSSAKRPVTFGGHGSNNVWESNRGFGTLTSTQITFGSGEGGPEKSVSDLFIINDCSKEIHFQINVLKGPEFSIRNPRNPANGQIYTWEIVNRTVGDLMQVDFGSEFWLEAPFAAPAIGMRRTITFRRTESVFIEICRNGADIRVN